MEETDLEQKIKTDHEFLKYVFSFGLEGMHRTEERNIHVEIDDETSPATIKHVVLYMLENGPLSGGLPTYRIEIYETWEPMFDRTHWQLIDRRVQDG